MAILAPLLSFVPGLASALSPCCIILIPLLLCRFSTRDKKTFISLGILVVGFMLSYIGFALALRFILNSPVQNGVRLGLGLIFVVIGLLSLIGKLNPTELPLFNNPFLLGCSFSMLVTANPCTMPYLGVILTIGGADVVIHLAAFALGLISPAVLFTLFGQSLLWTFQDKTAGIFHAISKVMSGVLVASGFFLVSTMRNLGMGDVWMSALMMLASFAAVLRAFFTEVPRKEWAKPRNLLLLLALLLLTSAVVLHCRDYLRNEEELDFIDEDGDGEWDEGEPLLTIPSFGLISVSQVLPTSPYRPKGPCLMDLVEENERIKAMGSCHAAISCPACRRCGLLALAALMCGAVGIAFFRSKAEQLVSPASPSGK
ncbi:hypothetical protein PAPYR_729 [Paratrimastix pyriformis]|uniref:Cytochrome C biogenesis protein transmembrane domain-containing protein n=1 Tax=Paratrimastix pyriformis TaxID=342808 RepID=A0ABQ8UUA7_9EUKA|nr:hypothetical protein PAPYR_729 [Paratrimastix pyriformis]